MHQDSGGKVCKHLRQVKVHPRNDRLCFRIAEAAIELEHFGSGRCKHQTDIKEALIENFLSFQPAQSGLNDGVQDGLSQLWWQELIRRICAHAPCVWAAIAVKNSLVVARRHERGKALPIGNHNERKLFSFKRLLQQQPFAARAELILVHQALDKILIGSCVLSDKDPLAGAQTVGLYDHRPINSRKCSQGVRRRFKHTIHLRGRNALSAKKLLRENLAAFELRGVLRRGHDRPVTVPERIANPVYQRQFWSDDCEIGLQTPGQSDKPWHIGGVGTQGHAVPLQSPVSSRTTARLRARALLPLPDQCLLASPAPDDQNLPLYASSQDSFSLSDFCTIEPFPPRINLARLPFPGIEAALRLAVFRIA